MFYRTIIEESFAIIISNNKNKLTFLKDFFF